MKIEERTVTLFCSSERFSFDKVPCIYRKEVNNESATFYGIVGCWKQSCFVVFLQLSIVQRIRRLWFSFMVVGAVCSISALSKFGYEHAGRLLVPEFFPFKMCMMMNPLYPP